MTLDEYREEIDYEIHLLETRVLTIAPRHKIKLGIKNEQIATLKRVAKQLLNVK
jgi:hypothetical protein